MAPVSSEALLAVGLFRQATLLDPRADPAVLESRAVRDAAHLLSMARGLRRWQALARSPDSTEACEVKTKELRKAVRDQLEVYRLQCRFDVSPDSTVAVAFGAEAMGLP
jgi:hypothetical protein